MFFFFSKVLDVIFEPVAWVIVLVLVALARPWSARARMLGASGVAILWILSTQGVSNALERSLELPVLESFRKGETYDAVILLGGVTDGWVMASWGKRAFNQDNERLLETYDLLRSGEAKNAIISGGPPSAAHPEAVEATALAHQLVDWGIDPARVVVEDRAKNTHENAVYSVAIVREHDWKKVVVVTSGFHMARAVGCFRAEGLAVDTLPVDPRSYGPAFRGEVIPRATYLADSAGAIREWAGRAVYRIRGYSK